MQGCLIFVSLGARRPLLYFFSIWLLSWSSQHIWTQFQPYVPYNVWYFPYFVKERVIKRTFSHPFLSGFLCPKRTLHCWVKPCFRSNPDSTMGKTLVPYWMEASLNCLYYQVRVEITSTHSHGTFPFHPLESWSFLLWSHFLPPLGRLSAPLGRCQVCL